jgi:hypothetical protein
MRGSTIRKAGSSHSRYAACAPNRAATGRRSASTTNISRLDAANVIKTSPITI